MAWRILPISLAMEYHKTTKYFEVVSQQLTAAGGVHGLSKSSRSRCSRLGFHRSVASNLFFSHYTASESPGRTDACGIVDCEVSLCIIRMRFGPKREIFHAQHTRANSGKAIVLDYSLALWRSVNLGAGALSDLFSCFGCFQIPVFRPLKVYYSLLYRIPRLSELRLSGMHML